MARRKPSKPILPFPSEIDRHNFANYITGFTDGEGCFFLRVCTNPNTKRNVPLATFSISLRSDDDYVLRLIQSYFACGKMYADARAYSRTGNPKTSYRIHKTADLANIIIPHFTAYPLFAKKVRDFAIWKEGVLLLHRVLSKPRCNRNTGRTQWTSAERADFGRLVAALKAQRVYRSPTIEPPRVQTPYIQRGLFD